ncbi:hypothetical protein R1flu_016615 [Riccia fluitans]|uniref:Fucosyltransferase n=1 Tax=Riccia fluitans TaxID=41844 RepID=A0ABD1YQG2_9MARC
MAGPNSMRAGSLMAGRKRWTKWIQLIAVVVVLGEVVFLLRLDSLKGEYFDLAGLASLNTAVFQPGFHTGVSKQPDEKDVQPDKKDVDHSSISRSENKSTIVLPSDRCEAWLEDNDNLEQFGRNFTKSPIYVAFGENQVWPKCAVGCVFRSSVADNIRPDGVFRPLSGAPSWAEREAAHILRSMESASYYPENDLGSARRRGYDLVMTTNLLSEVPVGYFSWAEYDLMSPVERKTESAWAAAFISNCGAHNFRLEALEGLKKHGVTIDSYGHCLRTHDGRGVNKLKALRHYKFSLAFENSNEDDYVTEKFWQSLVAGSVPVVVGAPNIENFAPASNAVLHIKDLHDIKQVAKQIKYLASNFTAYNETLRWKYEGPSDQFKALVDMAAVHSSCRLCLYLATKIREKEEKQLAASGKKPRPCRCTNDSGGVTYHLYVRERGRFELQSVFLKSTELTAKGLRHAVLSKFESMDHVPVWWEERPTVIREAYDPNYPSGRFNYALANRPITMRLLRIFSTIGHHRRDSRASVYNEVTETWIERMRTPGEEAQGFVLACSIATPGSPGFFCPFNTLTNCSEETKTAIPAMGGAWWGTFDGPVLKVEMKTVLQASIVRRRRKRRKFVDSFTSFPELVAILYDDKENPGVVEDAIISRNAAWALANLGSSHALKNKAKMAAVPRVLKGLVKLLQKDDNAGIQEEAARALRNLACEESNNQTISQYPGALSKLLRLLTNTDGSPEVQMQSTMAIINLLGNSVAIRTAAEEEYRPQKGKEPMSVLAYRDALTGIIKLLFPDGSLELQEQAAYALIDLVENTLVNRAAIMAESITGRGNVEKIADLPDALTDLVRLFSDDPLENYPPGLLS